MAVRDTLYSTVGDRPKPTFVYEGGEASLMGSLWGILCRCGACPGCRWVSSKGCWFLLLFTIENLPLDVMNKTNCKHLVLLFVSKLITPGIGSVYVFFLIYICNFFFSFVPLYLAVTTLNLTLTDIFQKCFLVFFSWSKPYPATKGYPSRNSGKLSCCVLNSLIKII